MPRAGRDLYHATSTARHGTSVFPFLSNAPTSPPPLFQSPLTARKATQRTFSHPHGYKELEHFKLNTILDHRILD
jgi:hypothetical protein